MPQNPSLLLSQEPQEQVRALLLQGFSQTLASFVLLGKILTQNPSLHQHKKPSAQDNRAKYKDDEVHVKETSSL
jgi:hypothetical protein